MFNTYNHSIINGSLSFYFALPIHPRLSPARHDRGKKCAEAKAICFGFINFQNNSLQLLLFSHSLSYTVRLHSWIAYLKNIYISSTELDMFFVRYIHIHSFVLQPGKILFNETKNRCWTLNTWRHDNWIHIAIGKVSIVQLQLQLPLRNLSSFLSLHCFIIILFVYSLFLSLLLSLSFFASAMK